MAFKNDNKKEEDEEEITLCSLTLKSHCKILTFNYALLPKMAIEKDMKQTPSYKNVDIKKLLLVKDD